MKGTVSWFSDLRGFGFISSIGYDNDIFFHKTNLLTKYIKKGDEVDFNTKMDKKGLIAINITKV